LAVKIRMRRMGAKNRPSYRFVATDSRMPRDGRFIEILGYYSPIDKPAKVNVKEERMYHWLKQGATPSDTVNSILKQIGLMRKWEMMKKGEDVSGVTILTQLKDKAKRKKGKKAKAAADGEKDPEVKAEKAEPKEEKKEEEPAAKEEQKEEAKPEEKKEEPPKEEDSEK
jgi:small subunit ribosomal protein S16